MAVQAQQYQYQSNLFLLLRAGGDSDNHVGGGGMAPPHIIQPSLLPPLKRRKRTGEATPAQIQGINAALQPQLSMVSTGLRLAFTDHRRRENQSTNQIRLVSDEAADKLAHQRDDLHRFFTAKWDEIRRAVVERQRLGEISLVRAAEAAAEKTMREKEAEAQESARRTAELENRISDLRKESMAWQTKALAEQATANALKHQLQQTVAVAAAAAEGKGEATTTASDAGSAHIDPSRVEPSRPSSQADEQRPTALCRGCEARHVSVVLLPCRHLCLCADCDAARAAARAPCPVCCCPATGSVPVFLS